MSVALIVVVSTAVLHHSSHALVNFVFGATLYIAEWAGLWALLRRRGAYTHTRFAATLVLLLAMSVLVFLLFIGADEALHPDNT